jgi:hypothetical protein
MKPTFTRREMVRRSLRYGGLGAIGGIAAWLGARSLQGECRTRGPCGGCPLFDGCALPKAESAKHAGIPRTYPSDDG